MTDPASLTKALDWVLWALAALLAFLYRQIYGRVDAVEKDGKDMHEAIHDIRNKLPSEFERREIDRRRTETQEAFNRIFAKLDHVEEVSSRRHLEVMAELNQKQDKAR